MDEKVGSQLTKSGWEKKGIRLICTLCRKAPLSEANPRMVKEVTLDRWMSHAITNADLALEPSEIPTGCTISNSLVLVKICSTDS